MMKWHRLLILVIPLLCAIYIRSAEGDSVSDGTLRRIHLPILMYHYVDELPPNADDIRRGLTISPQLFRDHLSYLQQEGYQTITFRQAYEALMTGSPLPPKPVILTFDDGYDHHYSVVFPMLREFRMVGTFYVITGLLDNERMGYMTWEQAAEMANAGMEIGAHTKNHIDLRARSFDTLVYEIVGSIESVTAHTGHKLISFSYPIGRYDEDTLAVMATLSPIVAVTTQAGSRITSDQLLEVPRLRINPDTSVFALSRLLRP